MTDRTQLLTALAQANPVPDPVATAEQLDAHQSLLAVIDERSEEMQSPTLERRAAGKPPLPPRRRAVLGFAAALILVLAVVGAVALIGGGDDDVVDQPTTTAVTPTTTIAPTTTVAPPTTASPTTTSPATTTEPPATTTTLPAMPARLGTTWERVPESEALQDGWIATVVEAGPGLVAVGGSNDGNDAGVWVSADAVTWERITSPAFGGSEVRQVPPGNAERLFDGDQAMLDVVATDSGLVAVGFDEMAEQLVTVAAVWLSPDGRTWERAARNDTVFPPNSSIHGVIAGGPGLVAYGELAGFPSAVPGVWTSADGRAWTAVESSFAPTAQDLSAAGADECVGLQVMGVAAGSERLVAAGYRTIGSCDAWWQGEGGTIDAIVWVSDDGFEWERLAEGTIAPPAPGAYADTDFFAMQGVTVSDAGFVAIGHGAWTSADGRTWLTNDARLYGDNFGSAFILGWPATVAEADGRLVANFGDGILWVSGDGGTGWHPSAEFDGGIFEAADSPEIPPAWSTANDVISTPFGLVGVGSAVKWSGTEDIGGGCYPEGPGGACRSDAAIWIGTWNEE